MWAGDMVRVGRGKNCWRRGWFKEGDRAASRGSVAASIGSVTASKGPGGAIAGRRAGGGLS